MLNPSESFDYCLVQLALSTSYNDRVQRVYFHPNAAHNAMLALASLPKCAKDEMWAVVDCGATHHYHPTRMFMLRVQEINILINGLTGPGPRATGFGLFLGLVEAYNRREEQRDRFRGF